MLALIVSFALADPILAGDYQVDHSSEDMAVVHDAAVQSAMDALPWALREFARRPIRRVIYNCGQLGIALNDATLTLGCDDKADKVLQRSADGHTTLDGYGETVSVELTVTPATLSVVFERSEGIVTTDYTIDGDRLHVRKSLTSHWLRSPVVWEVDYQRRVAD